MEKAREFHFGAVAVNPRGLSRVEAAVYVGVSPSLFDAMVKDGRMPQPKRINSRTVWDRRRLDDAFEALPYQMVPITIRGIGTCSDKNPTQVRRGGYRPARKCPPLFPSGRPAQDQTTRPAGFRRIYGCLSRRSLRRIGSEQIQSNSQRTSGPRLLQVALRNVF